MHRPDQLPLEVLLAHPGTQHAFTLASQLHRRNLLHEFWTCFGLAGEGALAKTLRLLPSSIRRRFENRIIPGLSSCEVRTLPCLEVKALRQLSRGIDAEKVMLERNRQFQEAIADGSIKAADVVIGFDTSSWLLVDRSKRAGKRFILDQTTAHPRAGLAAWKRALEDFPEWRDTAPVAIESLLANQKIEHDHADLIIAASLFARDTLIANGATSDRVQVNPYGVDLDRFHPDSKSASRPIRFIFVGGITARKGVPVLLAAWKELQARDAELWLVGEISGEVRKLVPDLRGLKIVGKKSRVELPQLLRSCDVFVLPSYCEGFGLVLLEAMASGLPIIATEATAASDLIGSTNAGRLIETGNVENLVDAMNSFLRDRDQLSTLSRCARAQAEKFTWVKYGDRWQRILGEIV